MAVLPEPPGRRQGPWPGAAVTGLWHGPSGGVTRGFSVAFGFSWGSLQLGLQCDHCLRAKRSP